MYIRHHLQTEWSCRASWIITFYSLSEDPPFPSYWHNIHLVKDYAYETTVTSMAPRPGHEVMRYEHWRHGTWTGEGPADPLTYLHTALRIIRMTATNYEWRVRNTTIEPDWLNMLVDRGKNKVTSFKLTKYDFAAAYLDTSCCRFYWRRCKHEERPWTKRIHVSTAFSATSASWKEKGMIL